MALIRQEPALHSLTSTYLESFTTQELLLVAAQLAVDTPEGFLNRDAIIGEILDAVDESLETSMSGIASKGIGAQDAVFEEISGAPESTGKTYSGAPNSSPFAEVRIPRYYNATFVKALVRDPLWVFVFWEIKPSFAEKLKSSQDFDGLCLRFCTDRDAVYSIPVGYADNAWYLEFPPRVEGDFFVEICARYGEKEEALARSEVFSRPRFFSFEDADEEFLGRNPLAALSGLGKLEILHKHDVDLLQGAG